MPMRIHSSAVRYGKIFHSPSAHMKYLAISHADSCNKSYILMPKTNNYSATIPEVCVSAIVVASVDPAVLMALTVMVYLLSSLRFLRVCDLMEPSEIVCVHGAPCGAEHLLMVYLHAISKLSMTPDTVQVMVRVVAVGVVTWRLFTGPGGSA